MPLNVQDKKAIVADVGAQLAGAQTVVLAEYRGIPVEELTKLRASARDQGVYLRVLKNTLARRATQGTQFEPLADSMVGPLIYGISADPIASAKVLQNFAKTQDLLVIKAGLYNGKLLDVAGVKALATIPSREELLSTLLGVMTPNNVDNNSSRLGIVASALTPATSNNLPLYRPALITSKS